MGPGPSPPDPTPQGVGARHELDRSLAAGLAWTGSAKWGAQLLSWASTLIVARLLSPTDYGITGMAGVYFVLIQQVSEFGLGVAVIQQRGLQTVEIARLGGLAVLIGIGLSLLSVGLAPAIAAFYGEPAVGSVLLVTAGMFAVTAFQVIPSSLLAKELSFRRLALIETAEALIQAVLTLALAVAGARYWALVLGAVVARSTSTILLVRARPHRLQWPRDLRTLRGPISFGWRVVISRLTWYVYSNSDFMIIGRLLGAAPLGTYTLSWSLASVPVDKLSSVIGRVAMPGLSAVQDDRTALARYFLLGSEGLALLVLPASLGFTLVAPEFVAVVLGQQWLPAVIPLQVLSSHVTVRCLNSLASQVILALGDARQSARTGMLLALTLPITFVFAATRWGINGVAFAWLVVYPLVSVPFTMIYAMRRTGLSAARFLRALWPAVSSAAAMSLVVILFGSLLRDWAAATRLATEIAAGVLTYGAILGIAHRRRLREILAAVRALRQPATTQ